MPLFGAYSNNPYGYDFLPDFLSRDQDSHYVYSVIGQCDSEAGQSALTLPDLHGDVSFNNPSPLRTVYTLLALS